MSEVRKYSQTIDFYWKSISFYSIVLILYSLMAGSIEEGTLSLKLADPFVILLSIIIVASAISMLSRFYGERAITVTDEGIQFSNRFREKFYSLSQIEGIDFARERIFRTRRRYSVIKIKVANKIMPIRIRPSAFDEENGLVEDLKRLKSLLKGKK